MATITQIAWRRVVIGTTIAIAPSAGYQFTLSIVQSRSVESISVIEGVGYLALTMLFLGTILVLGGINKLLTTPTTIRSQQNHLSYALAPLGLVLRNKLSARVRVIATTVYGVFFALLSGIVVYQPDLNFATLYGVHFPSTVLVTCCGSFGKIPQLVFFATEHLGVVVTPLMLTLLLTVSWLVGINLAVIANAFRARRTNQPVGLMSGMGSVLGVLLSLIHI